MKPTAKNVKPNQKTLALLSGNPQTQMALLFEKKNITARAIKEKSQPFAYITLIISIYIFSYIAFTAYRYHKIPDNLDEIPVLRNDIAPLKFIPSDIGGEQFSNQDKLIYSNFEDQKIAKYQKKVIKAQQKKEWGNPVIEAASKEILDTEQATKPKQSDAIEKPSAKNKSSKQKQTVINNKTSSPSPKKNKPNSSSSIFNLLD